jgi:hypothetical protein
VTALRRRGSTAFPAIVVFVGAGCAAEPDPEQPPPGMPAAGTTGGLGSAGSTGGLGSGSGGSNAGAGDAGTAGRAGGAGGSTGGASGGTAGAAGGVGGGALAGAGGTAGSAGSSAGAGGTPSSGGAGAGATAGAAGIGGQAAGAAGSTGGAAGSAGASTSCAESANAICEDFESTADGAVPSGWTKSGNVGASSNAPHRGAKSLEIGAATNGARRMRLADSRIAALGGTHWGRIFYKVKTPAPAPASGVIHSTIVAWDAMSPISGTNEVRVVDTVEDTQGRHQYLYNVQTSDRGEFGKGSTYDFSYDGAWYCAEWFVDYATQTYRFFLDGEELESIRVMNGAGNFQNSELPSAFTALSIGWNNYQQAPSPGFVAWIDDVALGGMRIGCD